MITIKYLWKILIRVSKDVVASDRQRIKKKYTKKKGFKIHASFYSVILSWLIKLAALQTKTEAVLSSSEL